MFNKISFELKFIILTLNLTIRLSYSFKF